VLLPLLQSVAPVAGVAVPPPVDVSSGTVLLNAVVANWPIVVALFGAAAYMGKLTKAVESLASSLREGLKRIDGRLDGHSRTLDEHAAQIARGEAQTEILLTNLDLKN
jgi:hypothetical protein